MRGGKKVNETVGEGGWAVSVFDDDIRWIKPIIKGERFLARFQLCSCGDSEKMNHPLRWKGKRESWIPMTNPTRLQKTLSSWCFQRQAGQSKTFVWTQKQSREVLRACSRASTQAFTTFPLPVNCCFQVKLQMIRFIYLKKTEWGIPVNWKTQVAPLALDG